MPPISPCEIDHLSSIFHELRASVSPIMAHSEMLVEGVHGPILAPQVAVVHSILHQARGLISLMDDLATIWQPRPSYSNAQEVCPVDQICQQAAEQQSASLYSRGISLQFRFITKAVHLAGESSVLLRLLSELVACNGQIAVRGAQLSFVVERDDAGLLVYIAELSVHPLTGQDLLWEGDCFNFAKTSLERTKPIGWMLLQHLASESNGRIFASRSSTGGAFLGLCFSSGVIMADLGSMPAPVFTEDQVSRTVTPVLSFDHLTAAPLVLIADDQTAILNLVQNYLEGLGCRVITTEDGNMAVSLAGEQTPDLIFMDLRMPHLGGLAALRLIRESNDPRLAVTPVVCISGYPAPGERASCLSAGANDYLSKPFGVKEIDRLIKIYLPTVST